MKAMTSLKDPIVLPAVSIDQPDLAYQKLATQLGIKTAKIPSDVLLRHALSSLSIGVYNYDAVRRYLVEKRPEKHYLTWVPVSTQTKTSAGLVRRMGGSPGSFDRGIHGHIREAGVYDKPLPYPVLVTMAAIVAAAKKTDFTPSFYVSDYVEYHKQPEPRQRLDPFLAVGTSDSDALFVIERWDEPGFREETYSSKKKAASGKVAGKSK